MVLEKTITTTTITVFLVLRKVRKPKVSAFSVDTLRGGRREACTLLYFDIYIYIYIERERERDYADIDSEEG